MKVAQFREALDQASRDLFSENLLTVSIGVASFPSDGTDAEQLLAEADRRMYKEKRARKQRQQTPESVWSSNLTATVQ